METLPSSQVVSPFGKINVWKENDGGKKVRAYILVKERVFEGAKTGLAIDGSASMRPAYGFPAGLAGLWSNKRTRPNLVSTEARKFCAYLAGGIDTDGKTAIIYWGTGPASRSVEEIGEFNLDQASLFDYSGPKQFGGGATALLPALRYFVDHFAKNHPANVKRGIYVFLTDGVIGDLEAVKQYSTQLAQSVASGTRKPLKFIIIGIGDQIDERQMIELDDLDTGTNVDLWYHKIAKDVTDVAEIGIELVDENLILADQGLVRDAMGHIVEDYRDRGLPALLEFSLPPNAANAFVLELGGQIIRQPLP